MQLAKSFSFLLVTFAVQTSELSLAADVLRCKSGMGVGDRLTQIISANAAESEFASMNVFVHASEGFIVTCGRMKNGFPYEYVYSNLELNSEVLPPRPLSLLAPFQTIFSHQGGTFDGSKNVPALIFYRKKFTHLANYILLGIQYRGQDSYSTFSCYEEEISTTGEICREARPLEVQNMAEI